jgi:hypothetical protein
VQQPFDAAPENSVRNRREPVTEIPRLISKKGVLDESRGWLDVITRAYVEHADDFDESTDDFALHLHD